MIIISSLTESLFPAISNYPFYRIALIYAEFNLVIPFLTSPKVLFPLNLGPRTGKLGRHDKLIYLSTSFSYLISFTLIYS
jgi:hypothetical protein